ncbi:uncharacterized protein LOC125221398 [Salvia hispanica]|uniref:uncharacterized protein LOC125221398 n=1 Tax=Salvia hispanica TaxID=49212 RepID=UPI002009B241|nr:uncharacterized protein LOC125221398 [Salvia hispanica]
MASSRAGGSGGGASDSDGFSDDELDLAVQAAIDRRIRQRQRRQQAAAAVPRPIHRRRHVPRDHIAAHQRLYEDYFAPEPRFGDALFRRRFRMHRPLFMHIVGALERRYEFFRIREDAAGKPGHTPIQKCTAAIRQLAYGGPADMFDEYLHIGESSAVQCLLEFCAGVRAIFGDQYLRRPGPEDCQQLINMHGSVHGFPGMLGSIDCMHWEWRNCPAAWKGIHTSGFKANFVANDNHHNMGYYLADGIYPSWPVFMKSIKHPVGPKKNYFATRQEAARKDVERAFGALQSRWAMEDIIEEVWTRRGGH